jgi:hypothetical protein
VAVGGGCAPPGVGNCGTPRVGTCPNAFGGVAGGGFGPTVSAVVVAGNGRTVGFTTVVLMVGTIFVAAPLVTMPVRTVGKALVGAGKVGKFVAALRSIRARIAAIELVSATLLVCARASKASAARTRRRIGFITYFLGGLAELVEIVLLAFAGFVEAFVVREGGGVVIVFGGFVFGGEIAGEFDFVAGLGAAPDSSARVVGAFFF